MPVWLPVVALPGAVAILFAILMLSQLVEQRVLSPQSMVRVAAKARRTRPEYAEMFVAAQLDPLVRELGR